MNVKDYRLVRTLFTRPINYLLLFLCQRLRKSYRRLTLVHRVRLLEEQLDKPFIYETHLGEMFFELQSKVNKLEARRGTKTP